MPAGSGEFRAADPLNGLQAVQVRREGEVATRIDTPLMAFEGVGPLMQPPALALTTTLAILTSLGILTRTRRRFSRDVSRSPAERRAATIQTLTAVAWLTSAAAFAAFALEAAADQTTLLYDWPWWWPLIFSAAALVASLLSAGTLVVLAGLWRDRDGDWMVPRKLRLQGGVADLRDLCWDAG